MLQCFIRIDGLTNIYFYNNREYFLHDISRTIIYSDYFVIYIYLFGLYKRKIKTFYTVKIIDEKNNYYAFTF